MIEAAGVVIARLGPAFTLADVAGEAGIVAGTLVQRFGSKHGLLVAMTRTVIESIRQEMRAAAAADPMIAPVELLVRHYAALDAPDAAVNNLAQLAFDLADPELRELMAEFYAAMEAELVPSLCAAVDAGVLPGAPPPAVAARILTAVADGTAIHWSTRPIGGLADRLCADLEAIMSGWRRTGPA